MSLCGWLKGRIGLAGCPTGAEDNARPLKSGLGSGGVIRPYCPLLSQKVANPPASARRDGQSGSFGLAAATQPLAKRKKTRQRRQAGTPLFCIYDPILQLVDGNVKHQVASERVSRRTRVLRKNPGSGAVKSRSARDSLIRRKNSLMARINSLQGRIKFPVPMSRELDRKPLNSAIDFEPIVALGGLDEQNSLYFPS